MKFSKESAIFPAGYPNQNTSTCSSCRGVSSSDTIYNGEKSRADILAVSPRFADFSVLRPPEFAKKIYILIIQRIKHVFINLI